MHFINEDDARGSRTLLTLVPKSRLNDVNHSLVQIGIFVYDDRVFSAHLTHHALDMLLPWLMIVSSAENLQANLPRPGKSDKLHCGMPYKVSSQFTTPLP